MRVHPRIRARPSNCSESPKASGTVLGWRHPWTPCGSMGVTIRWLWVKQPSLFSHGPIGASCPAGAAPPCQGPRAVTGCAHVVRMWALLALPLAPPLRLYRQVQRLDVGRWTGSPGEFSGSVCLRNSPRPCESRSHLSGSSCRERGSGALACRRAGRPGRGAVCLINTYPSGVMPLSSGNAPSEGQDSPQIVRFKRLRGRIFAQDRLQANGHL